MSLQIGAGSYAADVAVVGAGPAGLAAADAAARAGARVLLIDAARQFGGQYWRHADEATETGDPSRWHHGWRTYTGLATSVRAAIDSGQVLYRPGTQVWSIARTDGGAEPAAPGYLISTAAVPEAAPAAGTGHVRVRTLILCPGAYDKQVPVPGWTLPGVMAAGGVQAFIKTQGLAPGARVFLGGTGPFLLSAAASVLQAGAQVRGVAEAAALRGWFPRGVTGLAVPSKLQEGVAYAALLARHRVPYRTRTAITDIHGQHRVEAVTIAKVDSRGTIRPGSSRLIGGVDVVGLGWGFTPQTELLLQLDAHTRVDLDGSLVGTVDGEQRSSVPGLFLAGEITGVAGATAAVAEGRIAGVSAASLAHGTVGGTSRKDRLVRRAHRAFARAMHHAHPLPPAWTDWLQADTIVCRCEEVPWSRAREAGDQLGAAEPRGLKGTTRIGMGWCQGRMCALAAVCGSRPRESTGSGAGQSGDGAPAANGGGPHLAAGAATADTRARTPAHDALISTARRPVAMPVTFTTMADSTAAPPAQERRGSDPHSNATKEQR